MAKANINATDKEGRTPLHFASLNVYTEIVELLLTAKANVNAVDNSGNTALALAAKKGRNQIVELLKKYGATK